MDRLQNHVSMRSAHLEATYLEALQYLKKLNVLLLFFYCLFFQIAQSQNRVYLNAGSLMLNINEDDYDKGIKTLRMPEKAPEITPEEENPMNLRED